ncbi:MAG: polysaccharide deacetylase family protein [Gammaproteobacteria bacterium]
MKVLPTHGRYGHSAIVTRPLFQWPNKRRLAVYFAVGVEHYAFGEGMTENLVSGNAHPDVLNTSWREYGNRVGAWRMLQYFADVGVPLSILLNSAVCEHAPDLIEAARRGGHEFIAHGYSNSDTLAGMSEPAERDYLSSVASQIERSVGVRPQGWASPWIAETLLTPDLLNDSGYSYVLDWCMDDQPVWLKTRSGALLSVPYSQEINDSSTIVGRQFSATDFADMIVDQFDEMFETAGEEPLVMSVILHSFISGQPFRLRALRRAVSHIMKHADLLWITRPGDIARHFTLAGPRT